MPGCTAGRARSTTSMTKSNTVSDAAVLPQPEPARQKTDPHQRVIFTGVEALSDAELVAVILGTGGGGWPLTTPSPPWPLRWSTGGCLRRDRHRELTVSLAVRAVVVQSHPVRSRVLDTDRQGADDAGRRGSGAPHLGRRLLGRVVLPRVRRDRKHRAIRRQDQRLVVRGRPRTDRDGHVFRQRRRGHAHHLRDRHRHRQRLSGRSRR